MDYGFSSELPVDDPRQEIFAQQREERGFDDTELWALDSVIAKMLIPRLKAFKESHICHPTTITMEQWDALLQEMIDGFEEQLTRDMTSSERGRGYDFEKMQRGLKVFAEWYNDLWS